MTNEMKKTYMKPAVAVTIISMQQHLLADSYKVSNIEAQGDALSRRGGAWDDEEE